jgi:hypothetical protein
MLGATVQNSGRRMIGSLAVAIVLPVTYSKADNPRICWKTEVSRKSTGKQTSNPQSSVYIAATFTLLWSSFTVISL